MDKTAPKDFIDAEKELISLMGFATPVYGNLSGKFHAPEMHEGKQKMREFPQWGREGDAALSLIAEYGLSPSADSEKATVSFTDLAATPVSELIAAHADATAALRMALLRAAIVKRKLQNEQAAKA